MTIQSRPSPRRVAAYLGLLVHALLLTPLLVMGLVAPPLGVALLLVIWATLAVAAIVLLRRRPLLVPAIPALIIALTIAFLIFGDLVLGWTA